jgi:hypothetical protein
MAIRIICTQCEKQISIDSAFAGGICRCPYCKALVKVKKITKTGDDVESQSRPEAPPSRYDSLTEAPNAGRPVIESRPIAPQNLSILDARPVLFQGISGFVLVGIALAAILIAVALFVVLKPASQPEQPVSSVQWPWPASTPAEKLSESPTSEPATLPVTIVEHPVPMPAEPQAGRPIENPIAVVQAPAGKPTEISTAVDRQAENRVERAFSRAEIPPEIVAEQPVVKPDTPAVAKSQASTQPETPVVEEEPEVQGPSVLKIIPIHAPVVYCLDASKAFSPAYNDAAKIIISSINSLQDQDKYNIVLAGNGTKWLQFGNYTVRGTAKLPADEFFTSMKPSEQCDLTNALYGALSQKPTPATIVVISNRNPPNDPLRRVGQRAKASKTAIVCLALDATETSAKGMGILAASAGGKVKYYTLAELESLVGKLKSGE